ncbi:hypothetical protein IPO96_01600 [Candidatus Saccharibacteria bacterium]|nr:MAG: hypothetical protein IPO96_01600 [Candidatus Saccharibacteria bacterium]
MEKDPIQEYERMLEERYDDLTNGRDMYENTSRLRLQFDSGILPKVALDKNMTSE